MSACLEILVIWLPDSRKACAVEPILFSELDKKEKKSVTEFLKTFKPMYDLDDKKYSEYYFLLNSKKLAKG